MSLLKKAVAEHLDAVSEFFSRNEKALEELGQKTATCFKSGNKIIFAGNGGSACDAMHIAGEFVGRFVDDRVALPAIALSADSGIITAVGNDYGFEKIFSRQIEALGKKGDIFVALSTSGSSPNIIAALNAAQAKGIDTVLLTGKKGKASKNAGMVLFVESEIAARIQETHITALHILALLAEAELFSKPEEFGGRGGLEPTRYGDWENKGRVSDF